LPLHLSAEHAHVGAAGHLRLQLPHDRTHLCHGGGTYCTNGLGHEGVEGFIVKRLGKVFADDGNFKGFDLGKPPFPAG